MLMLSLLSMYFGAAKKADVIVAIILGYGLGKKLGFWVGSDNGNKDHAR